MLTKTVWIILAMGSCLLANDLSHKDLDKIAKMEYLKPYDALSKTKKRVVKRLLEKKLRIISMAKKSGIENSLAYKEALANAKKAILIRQYLQKKRAEITVTPQEISDYWQSHKQDFTRVHAYTIVRAKRDRLLEYVKVLDKTPKKEVEAKFKELAKKYSQHPRKAKGGDMGFIGYNSIVQPFGKEAFRLKKNSYTHKPFKTTLGYHLIYVKEIKVIPLKKASKGIEKRLRRKKYKKWFDKL